MNVKNIETSKLKPYDWNNKKHDKIQINNVAESIRQYEKYLKKLYKKLKSEVDNGE